MTTTERPLIPALLPVPDPGQAASAMPACAADRSEVAVVPAYGCEATIATTLAALREVGLPAIVVSDGSRDRTVERARAAGAWVLGQPGNHGKGSALAAGFAEALRLGARHVVTLDGDGQHAPADAVAMLEAARREPHALVIGQRSFEPALMPRRSIIGNRASRFWLRYFAGEAATLDVQCGYRVYPRWLLERHPPESRRFAVETELLLRTIRAGGPVVYVPVSTIYKPGGGSHYRVWPDTLPVCAVALRSLFW